MDRRPTLFSSYVAGATSHSTNDGILLVSRSPPWSALKVATLERSFNARFDAANQEGKFDGQIDLID